jgi:transposase
MAAERVVLRRRHSAELKALVLEQCAAPGASVAKVAMSHGVNANIVHGWRKLARERGGAAMAPPGSATLPAKTAASLPQFLPVSMAQTTSPPAPVDIQIELRRGATAMKITWPISAAAECGAWMRDLFIEARR